MGYLSAINSHQLSHRYSVPPRLSIVCKYSCAFLRAVSYFTFPNLNVDALNPNLVRLCTSRQPASPMQSCSTNPALHRPRPGVPATFSRRSAADISSQNIALYSCFLFDLMCAYALFLCPKRYLLSIP